MGNRRYERVGRGGFTRGTGRERLARRRSAREQERKKGDERPCGHGSVFRENASSSLALLERLPPRLIGRFTRCLLLVALHPQSIIPVVDVPRLLRQYVEAPWPPMRKRESERAPAVGLLGGCAVGGQLDTKTRAARVAYWCALRGSIFKFLPYMHTPPRPGESQGHTRISHVGMIRRNRHAPGPRERRTHPPTNTYNEHPPPSPLTLPPPCHGPSVSASCPSSACKPHAQQSLPTSCGKRARPCRPSPPRSTPRCTRGNMTTAHSSIMDVEYRLLSLAHLPLSPSRHSYSIGAGACCCVCGGRYACRRLPSPSVNISSASEQVAGDVSTASSSVFSFFVYPGHAESFKKVQCGPHVHEYASYSRLCK